MPDPSTQLARKRGRPTELERAQRRDEILDVAVQLFVERGFEAVTLDHIAAAAHVTKRTIYSYLGDRTEVFLAAVERLARRALQGAEATGGIEHVANSIVFTLHSDDAVGLHRLVIAESRRFPELAQRFYDEGPSRYIAAVEAQLSLSSPSGARVDAQTVFALLLGEPHRQRLLGLRPAFDRTEAAAHVSTVLAVLGVTADSVVASGEV